MDFIFKYVFQYDFYVYNDFALYFLVHVYSHIVAFWLNLPVIKMTSTHWGIMLLADQRPGTVNSPQCPFPWLGWWRSTMLATNGTFAHSYCPQNWLFYLNIDDFMISGFYL